jgi:hypothetical protein
MNKGQNSENLTWITAPVTSVPVAMKISMIQEWGQDQRFVLAWRLQEKAIIRKLT